MFKTLFLSVVLVGALTANAQDKMTQLENRISELEAAQSLNIFKFSGQLETMYDSIAAKQDDPAASKFDAHTDYLRLKFALNVDAAVSPKLNFYSRFITTAFFNAYDKQSNGVGTSPVYLSQLTDVRGESGTQLFVEKAYADYKMNQNFVLSFGRLPTEDGPMYHITENRPRSGTYPSLLYNTPLDGLALSYNHAVGDGQVSARVIYTPFTNYTSSDGKLGGSSIIIKPTAGGSVINTKTELTSVMAEYSNKMFSVIYQGYQTGKFFVGGEDLDVGGGPGSGRVDFTVMAHDLTVETDNIMNTGLTAGVTYLMSEVKNDGDINVTGLGHIYGLGADVAGKKLTGSTTLVSARYDFTGKMSLGAEYLMGGKNVFVYDTSSDNLTGFYSTPGTGTNVYVNWKLEPELMWKIGMTTQDYKNTPFTFGASAKTDRSISTIYTKLRLDF